MILEKMECSSCGSPLIVPINCSFITCKNCGSIYKVKTVSADISHTSSFSDNKYSEDNPVSVEYNLIKTETSECEIDYSGVEGSHLFNDDFINVAKCIVVNSARTFNKQYKN